MRCQYYCVLHVNLKQKLLKGAGTTPSCHLHPWKGYGSHVPAKAACPEHAAPPHSHLPVQPQLLAAEMVVGDEGARNCASVVTPQIITLKSASSPRVVRLQEVQALTGVSLHDGIANFAGLISIQPYCSCIGLDR